MKLIKPHHQIFLFLSDSPIELGRPFVRMQEFYESPSSKFRGKFFTHGDFEKWYCRTESDSGKFTYYQDFGGYNVPGTVVDKFREVFGGKLNGYEAEIIEMLGDTPKKYYVIGAPSDSIVTIDHELSHAFYHLSETYRTVMAGIIKGHDVSGITRFLKNKMYSTDMIPDELVSYIMCDGATLNRNKVRTKHLNGVRESMLKAYRDYKQRYIKGL